MKTIPIVFRLTGARQRLYKATARQCETPSGLQQSLYQWMESTLDANVLLRAGWEMMGDRWVHPEHLGQWTTDKALTEEAQNLDATYAQPQPDTRH